MPISQNVRFSGNASSDEEFDHPAGASIARLLQTGLSQRGWTATRIENWRDCSWEIDCARDGCELQVTVASIGVASEWMAQIAPRNRAGIIARMLRMRPSADSKTILALAKDVGVVLSLSGRFNDFKWRWDGFPQDSTSSPVPEEP
jgi:hypothetical protein